MIGTPGTLFPTALGGAQAAVSSAAAIKNIIAGFTPPGSVLDVITTLAKDIGGFEFDYRGEWSLHAGADITDHYTEANDPIQDHVALKPTKLILRGFVAEVSYSKTALIPSLLALSSALTPVTPYLGQYAPGAAAKMQNAVNAADDLINQLARLSSLAGSLSKLVGALPQKTRVQQAYEKLDALRTNKTAFAVVTPWATFGDLPDNGHGPMLIENLVLTEPEETTGWQDIVVTMKEIRTVADFPVATMDNARGSQVPTVNGPMADPNASAVA